MFRFHIRRTRDSFEKLFDLFAQGKESIHVITEYFYRDIRTHTGKQFIETHLYRLGEFIIITRHLSNRLFHGGYQLRFSIMRSAPFGLGLENNESIRNARRHRISGDLGGTDLGKDFIHFGKCLDCLLQLILHFDGSGQAGAGNTQRMQGNISFVEAGYKLGAQPCGQQPGQHYNHHGKRDCKFLVVHCSAQCRHINFLCPHYCRTFFFSYLSGEEECDGCRHECHGKNHRPEQCDHNGESHGMKHFSFHSGQCEDREVDHHDNQFAIDQYPARFSGCIEDY